MTAPHIDLARLKALALAAGGDEWTDDDLDGVVFGSDGDSVCICHANMGAMPEAIYPEHRSAFIAAANPAVVLKLIEIITDRTGDARTAEQRLVEARAQQAAALAHSEQAERTIEDLRSQLTRAAQKPLSINLPASLGLQKLAAASTNANGERIIDVADSEGGHHD